MAWSHDETRLVYSAEESAAKHTPLFPTAHELEQEAKDKSVPSKPKAPAGREFDLREDKGEQLGDVVGVGAPVW